MSLDDIEIISFSVLVGFDMRALKLSNTKAALLHSIGLI